MEYQGKGSYKLKDVKKTGTTTDTEVTEVKEGKLKEFIGNWQTYDKNGNADPDAPAIQVKTKTGARVVIALPPGNDAHPKSTLGKWLRTYGDAPHVGQAVKTVVNDKGFEDMFLLS